MKETIYFEDFTKLDIRVGRIIDVQDFPEARNPSYKLIIDFGSLGKKSSSAQITDLYSKEGLINKQILAVVNFPEKQIANFMSQCLVLGAVDGSKVILLGPEASVINGTEVA